MRDPRNSGLRSRMILCPNSSSVFAVFHDTSAKSSHMKLCKPECTVILLRRITSLIKILYLFDEKFIDFRNFNFEFYSFIYIFLIKVLCVCIKIAKCLFGNGELWIWIDRILMSLYHLKRIKIFNEFNYMRQRLRAEMIAIVARAILQTG